MTPLDALAASIRERLVSGRPAPLPGLGTLVRQHVSARVEERPDGTRVLLPPGETIGLANLGDEHESLASAFGRFRALPEADASQAFSDAMDQLEARLAATGEVRLPGVGLLRRTSGGVVLGVEADLLAAVNRTFEGLAPVGTGPVGAIPYDSPEPSPPEEPTALPSQPDDPDEPETAATERVQDETTESDTPEAVPPAPTAEPPADEPPPREPEGTAPDAWDEDDGEDPFGSDQTVGLDEFATVSLAPPPDAEPDLSLPADDPDAPVRDLSSEGPTTSFTSPAEVEDETDLPDADEWQPPAVPTEPVKDEGPSPTESAFVDDETLDADLDDVLAVPFGVPPGETPADVLPPTPPEHDPAAEAPDAEREPAETEWTEPEPVGAIEPDVVSPEPPASAVDDEDEWLSETWTAAGAGPPPPSFGDEPEIEDAEIVEDDADGGPDAVVVPPPATGETTDVPIERVGPEAEFDAMFAAPAGAAAVGATSDTLIEPAPEGETVAEADVPDDEPHRGFPWWLLALVLLALALAALVWLWPSLQAPRDADASGTPAATTPDAVTNESGQPLVADSLDATDGDTLRTTTSSGGAAPSDASSQADSDDATPSGAASASTGAGRAPAVGVAILPPRLAGLDAEDVRALSGDPVDQDAEAWTLIVLSTASREDAQALSVRYQTAGYRTAVIEVPGSQRRWRVAVGQFTSKAHAERLRDRLPPQAPPDTWPLDLRTL